MSENQIIETYERKEKKERRVKKKQKVTAGGHKLWKSTCMGIVSLQTQLFVLEQVI